jgi:hypothetical protein
MRSASFLGFLACLAFPTTAAAHINMSVPTPRHGMEQKDGPCGIAGSTRGNIITTFAPGEEITIRWSETVNHPGHYRVMFNPDGDTFPTPTAFDDLCDPVSDPMCIADGIADKDGGQYSYTFTLPTTPCDNCTIQLIQMMTDKPPFGGGAADPDGDDIYYECADIVIADPNETTATTSSTVTTGPDNGSSGSSLTSGGSGAAGGEGGANYAGPEADDGCAMRPGSTRSSMFLAILVGLFVVVRRRIA